MHFVWLLSCFPTLQWWLYPPAEKGCRTSYFSVSEAMFTLESLLPQILSACNSWLWHVLRKKPNFAVWAHTLCRLLASWYAVVTQHKRYPNCLWHCILQDALFLWFTKKHRGELRKSGVGEAGFPHFSFLHYLKSPAPSSYLSRARSWGLLWGLLHNSPGSGVI